MTDTTEVEQSPPTQADGNDLMLRMVEALERIADATNPTLFATDAEIIRRLGVPRDLGRAVFQAMDKNKKSGFPQRNELWGDRRYMPAVIDYFDAQCRHRLTTSPQRGHDDD